MLTETANVIFKSKEKSFPDKEDKNKEVTVCDFVIEFDGNAYPMTKAPSFANLGDKLPVVTYKGKDGFCHVAFRKK